ncbi:MAG: AlpA family phage regulatory protein [Gammaproteobacteria bacterium]|nr:AlpA family phage regulatory protein [Gammaproteobacteria bacterium]
MSAAQLAKRYDVDKSTIWRWSSRGILPKPVRLSGKTTRWVLDEIEHHDAQLNRTGDH